MDNKSQYPKGRLKFTLHYAPSLPAITGPAYLFLAGRYRKVISWLDLSRDYGSDSGPVRPGFFWINYEGGDQDFHQSEILYELVCEGGGTVYNEIAPAIIRHGENLDQAYARAAMAFDEKYSDFHPDDIITLPAIRRERNHWRNRRDQIESSRRIHPRLTLNCSGCGAHGIGEMQYGGRCYYCHHNGTPAYRAEARKFGFSEAAARALVYAMNINGRKN